MLTLATLIGIACTLAMFSFLYRENFFYRLGEHIYIGLSIGYGVVLTWDNTLKPRIMRDIIQDHHYIFIIPLLLGLLMYTRFTKNYVWLSRLLIGFWAGYNAGYNLGFEPPNFMLTVADTFSNLNAKGITWSGRVNSLLFTIFVLCVLTYFLFTVPKEKGILRHVNMIGRLTMMVSFGVAFGNTVAGRFSLLIGRLDYLFAALGLIK